MLYFPRRSKTPYFRCSMDRSRVEVDRSSPSPWSVMRAGLCSSWNSWKSRFSRRREIRMLLIPNWKRVDSRWNTWCHKKQENRKKHNSQRRRMSHQPQSKQRKSIVSRPPTTAPNGSRTWKRESSTSRMSSLSRRERSLSNKGLSGKATKLACTLFCKENSVCPFLAWLCEIWVKGTTSENWPCLQKDREQQLSSASVSRIWLWCCLMRSSWPSAQSSPISNNVWSKTHDSI